MRTKAARLEAARLRLRRLWARYDEINDRNRHYPSAEGDRVADQIGRTSERIERLERGHP